MMEYNTPSHDYTPTYQISLIYLERQKRLWRGHHNTSKYQLFDLEVTGQGQCRQDGTWHTLSWFYTDIPNIIILSEETKTLWPGEIVHLQIHSDLTMSYLPFLSIFLYNFTYIFFIWTVTHQFFYFIFLRNIWTIQLKNLKILWIRNGHFHQINASNNVFSFIVYINFALKCHFPLEFSN